MMHRHSQEARENERNVNIENRKLDNEVTKAKDEASDALNQKIS